MATRSHNDQDRIALQAAAERILAAYCPALPPPLVRCSARLTRSAGTYRPPVTVTISRPFLAQHGTEAGEAVLRHELAHHVVHMTIRRRVRPHGPEFRAVAVALDAPRYAPAFAATRTVHGYRCPACGWTWLRGRRLRQGRQISCGRCAPAFDARFRLVHVGSWRTNAVGKESSTPAG